ncbi:MAG: hypothetical protein QF681_04745 [Vicinamibacterales bacterium]|jgi:hypothetical protein|nr:hypothetical protein [Vicinamibacterales bacterium]
MIELFGDWISHHQVEVSVDAHDRRYLKTTPAQSAASSLIGIVMVTSGCPILDRFRPMVEIHLPFQTPPEATYRFLSMYLFTQYCIAHDGGSPDWELAEVESFLEQARCANSGIADRLRAIGIEDAGINALAILNAHGELTRFRLLDDDLEHWRRIVGAVYPR